MELLLPDNITHINQWQPLFTAAWPIVAKRPNPEEKNQYCSESWMFLLCGERSLHHRGLGFHPRPLLVFCYPGWVFAIFWRLKTKQTRKSAFPGGGAASAATADPIWRSSCVGRGGRQAGAAAEGGDGADCPAACLAAVTDEHKVRAGVCAHSSAEGTSQQFHLCGVGLKF